jgi:hypothetical protein
MHVDVGGAGPDSTDDLGEITSRELLGCVAPGYDVCSRDVPGDGAGLRAGLGPGWTGIRRRAAQPDDDAADHAQLADVDVGLPYVPCSPLYVNS